MRDTKFLRKDRARGHHQSSSCVFDHGVSASFQPLRAGGDRPGHSRTWSHLPSVPHCPKACHQGVQELPAGGGLAWGTGALHLHARAAFPAAPPRQASRKHALGACSLSASRSLVPSGRSQPGQRGTPGRVRGAEPEGGPGGARVRTQLRRCVSRYVGRQGHQVRTEAGRGPAGCTL